jgi:hypothetical protein
MFESPYSPLWPHADQNNLSVWTSRYTSQEVTKRTTILVAQTFLSVRLAAIPAAGHADLPIGHPSD